MGTRLEQTMQAEPQPENDFEGVVGTAILLLGYGVILCLTFAMISLETSSRSVGVRVNGRADPNRP